MQQLTHFRRLCSSTTLPIVSTKSLREVFQRETRMATKTELGLSRNIETDKHQDSRDDTADVGLRYDETATTIVLYSAQCVPQLQRTRIPTNQKSNNNDSFEVRTGMRKTDVTNTAP